MLNTADNIERQLAEDGYKVWGFVIYRCTYDNDEDWETFIEHLNDQTRRYLKVYNGLDMMVSLRITIFDDKDKFDGASDEIIREDFKK
jgi:hypothetical protein